MDAPDCKIEALEGAAVVAPTAEVTNALLVVLVGSTFRLPGPRLYVWPPTMTHALDALVCDA